ncbi:hypothetical protein V502_02952 [Pseudogymnoascus sp. VKM F-4520 (FW-2644)]|nr:hypothetical protein V502_02952 [Pseudogymnoascus sp. VKM F-4520 (FW-2644)]
MDTHVTLSPGEIMKQVAEFMRDQYPDVSVTIPTNATWRQVIRAVETALEGRDAAMTVKHKDTRTEARRARFRQIALENVASWARPAEDIPLRPNIRTKYDARYDEGPIPCPLVLAAFVAKRFQPRIKATITVKGVGHGPDDSAQVQVEVGMVLSNARIGLAAISPRN